MSSPYESMQRAVDIVLTSTHPSNKIAAGLYRDGLFVCHTNDWPARILNSIGSETRIGNSSGTVHAEVHCILTFGSPTDGGSLFVTDPPCPNCAKSAAEAGIKAIYIDHKGFIKDFAQRRGDDFESMSLRICERAGIRVYEIRRKEELITPILAIPPEYVPPHDNPIEVKPFVGTALPTQVDLKNLISTVRVKKDRWACGFARNAAGDVVTLVASLHAAIGYSEGNEKDLRTIANIEGKYSFYLEPMERLLMGAARFGYQLMDGLVWCSRLPTSREQVNLVAAGLTRLYISPNETGRNDVCTTARDQLENAGLLEFTPL